jgi:hypothetical protein
MNVRKSYKKPHPANRARRSKYRVGRYVVKDMAKIGNLPENPAISYFFLLCAGFSL